MPVPAPLTVHRLAGSGGRRVTARAGGQSRILGIAYNDRDLIEFARRVGINPDAAQLLLDDADWVAWEGEGPHVWDPS
ncbi:hypothetical protein [Streptomyces sp. NPDC014733]|uniref:hypothetical protein n=1 Tax=Streptomyces sp. NPDC014733 TaxID=3364885 RepID=UPI0036F5DB83